MFGQSDRIAWLCMANASNENLIILGITGLHWGCWLVSKLCWTGGFLNPDGACGLIDRTGGINRSLFSNKIVILLRWIIGYILRNSRFKIWCFARFKDGIFFGRFVQASLLAWPRLGPERNNKVKYSICSKVMYQKYYDKYSLPKHRFERWQLSSR